MTYFSIADTDGVVWLDGAFVPWKDATLHVLSHGLNNALCVFEGLRVYEGRVFRLHDHTRRLFASARAVRLDIPYSPDEIDRATLSAVAAQRVTHGYIRPIVWKGEGQLGIVAPGARVHVAIAALACDEILLEAKLRGLSLKISSWVRPAPDMAPVRAKTSASYLLGSLAAHEARDAGFDDALLLDHRGCVAEATGANFFMVHHGRLVTPPAECVLDGVTRRTILQLAHASGREAIERHIRPAELRECDEAFLTGTACEVTPIRRIDDIELPAARPVTDALAQAYQRLVRRPEGFPRRTKDCEPEHGSRERQE